MTRETLAGWYAKVLRELNAVVELYAIDWFVEATWANLPAHWRRLIDSTENPEDWFPLLDVARPLTSWPVSTDGGGRSPPPLWLLALRAVCRCGSVRRTPAIQTPNELAQRVGVQSDHNNAAFGSLVDWNRDPLSRRVKAKKRHELERLLVLIERLFERSNCDRVLDVGAGVGHLSRLLAQLLPRSCSVESFEMNDALVDRAHALDLNASSSSSVPVRSRELVDESTPLTDEHRRQCLVGLHACGDLGVVLLRHWIAFPPNSVLVLLSCCYHKMTVVGAEAPFQQNWSFASTADTATTSAACTTSGYPLSTAFRTAGPSCLSYVARESACHANEMMLHRRTDRPGSHVRRALLELLLVMTGDSSESSPPPLTVQRLDAAVRDGYPTESIATSDRHRPVASSSCDDFVGYVQEALRHEPHLLSRINRELSDSAIREKIEQVLVSNGPRLFAVYILRQMIAPLLESIILWDRVAYVEETVPNSRVQLIPLFEAHHSPRSVALVAQRLP